MTGDGQARTRTRVRRVPQRAVYERDSIEAILDEATVCHLGTVGEDGVPVVIPTLLARVGERLYVHGSSASQTIRRAAVAEVCLTATLIDGLVLARSAFHHSVNYRSVVVFARPVPIEDPAEKLLALEAFTEKLVPGRWADARPPTEQELRGTAVLRLCLDQASAKVRNGPPLDDEEDYALPVWAGTVPLALRAGEPVPDARLPAGVECPEYIARLAGPAA